MAGFNAPNDNTARQYAQRGQFNSRDLDSALTWVNARRTAKGLPLIGLPTNTSEDHSDDDAEVVISLPAPTGFGSLRQNSVTAAI